ncbi:hypothetical protein PQ478_05270 [Alkalihalophilus pseudofirmus]|uniref:hypothetical protein n=1 Tax=Alkalihalophilus pseudofirmus TaxID=79885 RepID=UPI00259BD9ED|nr:hypothetical protein [Alkalihalophilus pseudofirmus]WEG17906.1 hypothetical protein PQ478_05270 [Alkalihalophilus pseudofirmus]
MLTKFEYEIFKIELKKLADEYLHATNDHIKQSIKTDIFHLSSILIKADRAVG